jgi:hypothetical protein
MKLDFKPYRPKKPAKLPVEAPVPFAVTGDELRVSMLEGGMITKEQAAEWKAEIAVLDHKRKLNAERQRRYRAKKAAAK